MTLTEKIEKAFAHRQIPAEVIELESCTQLDSDVEDALWFAGRDWRSITWNEWKNHYCAVFFLSSKAFKYYLRGLLLLSIQNPTDSLLAVDSVIGSLDRSPSMDGWNDHFSARFLGFTSDEYEVIKEWLFFLSEYGEHYGQVATGPGDTFGRSFDTVELLQKETERRKLFTP